MGLRDVQALAAEARSLPTYPSYEASAPTSALGPALSNKIRELRATVANSTDTNSHAARTMAVMNELEKALQERTDECDQMRRNYGGLHSICEEYHEQLDALRDNLACGGEPDEMKRLKRREAELERQVEQQATALKEAERELRGFKAELSTTSAAVQEGREQKRKLQSLIQAAHGAAGRGKVELEAANAANAALKQELEAARSATRGGEVEAARARAEAQQAKAEVGELRAKVASEEAQAHAALVRLAALQRDTSGRSSLVTELEAALEQSKRAHAALQEGNAELASRCKRDAAAAEVQAQNMAAALTAEQSQVAELRAEVSHVREQWEEERSKLKLELHQLQTRLQTAEADRTAAQTELQIQQQLMKTTTAPAPAPAPPAPAPAPKAFPSLVGMQMEALQGELEGWRLVAQESRLAKDKVDADLRAAQRLIKLLKEQQASPDAKEHQTTPAGSSVRADVSRGRVSATSGSSATSVGSASGSSGIGSGGSGSGGGGSGSGR